MVNAAANALSSTTRHDTALLVLPLHHSNLAAKKVKVVDLTLFWIQTRKSIFVSHQCGYVWARLWLSAYLRVWPLSFHWVCWDVGGFRLQIWSITALGNPSASNLHACLLSGAAQILTRRTCHPKFLKRNVSWCCLVIAITLQSSSCDWKPWKWHYPVRRTTCWSHPSLSLALTTIC